MLVFLRRRDWLLKQLVIFCSSLDDFDELAMHASEVASISSIISTPHLGVDLFSDSEDKSRPGESNAWASGGHIVC